MIELRPGAAIADGRYRLERLLGVGGMASVWLGHDERLDRLVAVKVMSEPLAADASYTRRFEREARTAAGLSHPNLVRIFDYATDGERPALVMEYVEGGTLRDAIDSGQTATLDPEELARELLEALVHVHEAGIVHRDVKPANLLLGEDGRARLTDFGIAQPEDATRLTQVGAVIGTLKYLAPELIRGDDATPASDLYAAGVLLGECGGASAPDPLAGLIGRLSEHDPERRPRSARDALALLAGRAGSQEAPSSWMTVAAERTRALAGDRSDGPPTSPLLGGAPSERLEPRALWSALLVLGGRLEPNSRTAAAALGGLALVLVLFLLASGGEAQVKTPPPSAPRDAPLEQQLDALDSAVRDAAR